MTWALTGADARAVIDADFQALPLADIAQAALDVASAVASHAEVRLTRQRSRSVSLRDAEPLGLSSDSTSGIGVRVLIDGVWGFAAGPLGRAADAATVARQAIAMAHMAAPVARQRVTLADEPVHAGVAWANPVAVDPFDVTDAEVCQLLGTRSSLLLAHPAVQHVSAHFSAARDISYLATLSGTTALQQRTRVAGELTAFHIGEERFDDLRTTAPPAARGWEYLTGTDGAWDWDGEVDRLPELLAERAVAPSIEPGRYDLVLDPTNLWLTIHESVGHATELDRALGYEANYAGTSFATPDRLGSLRYGSDLMHVTGDRVAEHGLSSVGLDDEGVVGSPGTELEFAL